MSIILSSCYSISFGFYILRYKVVFKSEIFFTIIVISFACFFGKIFVEQNKMSSHQLIGSIKQHQPIPLRISDTAYEKAVAFKPRSTDCFVTTPPKTGTTLTQFIAHLLRAVSTSDIEQDELFKNANIFEDLNQFAPWAMMAWDLGYDITEIDYEQRCLVSNQTYPVRLFKSHQRLHAMNPGAKYISVIRNPKSTLVSWYNFLKGKDIPPLRKYTSPSEFAFDKRFFAKGMNFGASLWEYYNEYVACLRDPNVLIVVYEDLAKDTRRHLPVISRFLGLEVSDKHMDEITRLASRDEMLNNSKFDESWTDQQLKLMNRSKGQGQFKPVPTVTPGSDPSILSTEAIHFLDDQWSKIVEANTGIKNYEELADVVREEFHKR